MARIGRIDPAEFAAEKAAIVRMFQEAREAILKRQSLTEEEQVADTIPPPPPTLPAPADKTCSCGTTHDYFDWVRLPYVGVMGDDEQLVELRNCQCTSTIAVHLCAVAGCGSRAVDHGARCSLHDIARHLETSADREDFADEYAREDRRERELEWQR